MDVEIAVSGSLAPEFCEAMAGSFHFVILPGKMLEIVCASRFSDFMPGRLKATAIGLTYAGTSIGVAAAGVARRAQLVGVR